MKLFRSRPPGQVPLRCGVTVTAGASLLKTPSYQKPGKKAIPPPGEGENSSRPRRVVGLVKLSAQAGETSGWDAQAQKIPALKTGAPLSGGLSCPDRARATPTGSGNIEDTPRRPGSGRESFSNSIIFYLNFSDFACYPGAKVRVCQGGEIDHGSKARLRTLFAALRPEGTGR